MGFDARSQQISFQHKGEFCEVPVDYLDPAFPAESVTKSDTANDIYRIYYRLHRFPLPEEGDYERQLEIWVKNNRYFPQMLISGDSHNDSFRHAMAVEVWKQKNADAIAYITRKVNTTDLSDEDFYLLFNSFPRKKDSGNPTEDQRKYEESIQEWIRIYSYEKHHRGYTHDVCFFNHHTNRNNRCGSR